MSTNGRFCGLKRFGRPVFRLAGIGSSLPHRQVHRGRAEGEGYRFGADGGLARCRADPGRRVVETRYS